MASKKKASKKAGARGGAAKRSVKKAAAKKPARAAKKRAKTTAKKKVAPKKTAAKKKVAPKRSAGKKRAAPKRSAAKRPARAVARKSVKRAAAKKPARAPAKKAPKRAAAKAPASVRRRDHAGHIDPKYAAELHAKTGGGDDGARAFFDTPRSGDDLAEELGEEVVGTMTTGEADSGRLEAPVTEEEGGPFVETEGSDEFADGVDESNPEGATREPFPTA